MPSSATDPKVATSLGRLPIGTDDFNFGVLLPWVGILFGAAVVRLIDPPTFVTAEEGHGATIIGRPAAGVSYWILVSGALMMAGILGFVGARLRVNNDPLESSGVLSPK